MNKRTNGLLDQLKSQLIGASNGQIARIIKEATDEALAEAKAIIKEVMVQAILERALNELESNSSGTVDKEQIRQQIEATRAKIAENERLLSQARTSPPETNETQAYPAKGEANIPDKGDEQLCGYYAYGIIGDGSSQPIEGELSQESIDPAYPVYALPYQAIQAIVSKVSLREFGKEALKANLNDLEWLEAKVRAHQGVLQSILANHTIIPLKFCTIYRTENRLQEMLAQHYDDFLHALARLEGRKEWGVKVYCDREALTQKVDESSDKVKMLRAEMTSKSSGMAYFMKKKLEEAVAEEVERIVDEHAQRSHDRLSSHAEDAVINPLQGEEITGGREMILNGAYLVAEERRTAFQTELGSLQEEYSGFGFSYEMTGPWPPYNFVTIGPGKEAANEPIGG